LSTILKALRKIENESDQYDPTLTWPGPVQLKDQINLKLRNKQKKKQIVFLFFILVLICGSTWFYLLHSDIPLTPASETLLSPASETPLSPASEIPLKKIEIKTQKKQKYVDASRQHASKAVSKKQQKSMTAAVVPVKTAIPVTRPVEEVPVKTEISATESAAEVPVKTEVPVSRPAEEVPVKAEDLVTGPTAEVSIKAEVPAISPDGFHKLPPQLEVKKDSRIHLQAIAWSPDPESSFILINNRLFHEGDNFEGITITHIGKEDVSFKENGVEWQEHFRRK